MTNTLENRRKYNNSRKGRIQTAKSYQERHNGLDEYYDNLSDKDLIKLEKDCNHTCYCCGHKFSTSSWFFSDGNTLIDYDIAHIQGDGNLTINNIQLLCHACNMAQRDLGMNFRKIFQATGKFFIQLWNEDFEYWHTYFHMNNKDVKRFDDAFSN